MGETVIGTPSGTYTTTGFDCADLAVYDDDYFNDWNGRFYEATNKDKSFVVTAFAKSGGHITFSPAVTLVDALDLFYLLPDFTPTELINAINLAISMVEQEALQDKVDATLVVVADQYEYTIPTGFVYVDQIFQEGSTADRYSPSSDLIDGRGWRILHGSTPKIWFDDSYVSLTTGRNLRLVGQAVQSQLTLDANTCSVAKAYIVYQAKALLHQSRIRGEGADFEGHRSQLALAQTIANGERARMHVIQRGQKVSF